MVSYCKPGSAHDHAALAILSHKSLAGIDLHGDGSLDSSLDMEHVRDRLRTFYLGKQIINPQDVVNIFVRSNTSFDNFENKSQSESTIDKSYFEIDEVILKAE